MAVPSRGVRKKTETVLDNNNIQVVPYSNNNKKKVIIDRDHLHHYHHNHHQTITSPERTMVWIEPKSKPKMEIIRKVPVVYYLSKDGHLEHPHFIEVPLSSNDGLYLNDVINRLNSLRGKGMASMYSWSSKRSYKNGFVWHDLCENDFIYPAHGQEYVLKGSEFLETFSSFRSQNQEVMIPEKLAETQHYHHKSVGESNNEFPVVVVQTQRSRNQSWSSIDDNHNLNHLHEYKVYKTESSSTGEYCGKAADAATQTQTDHEKRRIRSSRRLIREEEEDDADDEQNHEQTTELSRDEISPPPSSSSPETLESLIKADVRIKSNIISEPSSSSDIRNLTGNNHPSGRVKASAVLKQLISCGSFTVKDGGGPEEESSNQGFSFIQHYRARLPHESSYHGAGNDSENPSCYSEMGLEDKEYFSGSLVEMKKDDYTTTSSSLTRSSSYNADRSSKLETEKETRGVREDEYIQKRKPKTTSTKKESNDNMNKISRTPLHGSKRHSHEPIR
ncbi:hypothetical protein MKX03_025491 [Papaver bracteatum]|nr:hypothetical protein MKX03_025491 [Papaver bracteatum]